MATKHRSNEHPPAPAAAAAAAPEGVVEAVVMLRSRGKSLVPTPSQSRAMAEAALSKAHEATGLEPETAQVFDQLHSFSVRAPSAFVAALAQLEDVAQVVPNAASGPMLIEPVSKKNVKLPD